VEKDNKQMEKTTVQPTVKSRLTGKYTLKPVRKTWLEQIDNKHDGLHIFSGAEIWIAPQLDDVGLIKTGLTDQEARELEVSMGMKAMSLSPYSKETWANPKLYAKVPQGGITIDCDRSDLDKVRFAYLSVCDRVALSYEDANENMQAEFVLSNQAVEAGNDSKKIMLKVNAMKKMSQMSLNEQIDFLRVYDEGKYKVSKAATADFVVATLGKIVDEQPQKFLDLVSNPDYKVLVFIQECLQAGVMKKTGPKYYVSGGDMIGASLVETINNLQDPTYNEVKISLKAKIDAIK
jgi:hypothetical protein